MVSLRALRAELSALVEGPSSVLRRGSTGKQKSSQHGEKDSGGGMGGALEEMAAVRRGCRPSAHLARSMFDTGAAKLSCFLRVSR